MNKTHIFIRDAANGAEGDSAEVNRLFPVHGFMNFDPFVLWDNFTISPGAGFPDHPHRGFEGVTYVMQGSVNHGDNLGNDSTVQAGGLQRFTAGKGIVHSEMPSASGETRGIQLWVNLPAELKQVEPDYQQVEPEQIGEVSFAGGRYRQLAGQGAALRLKTDVLYQDVFLEAGAQYRPEVSEHLRGFIYLLDGAVDVSGESLAPTQACFVEAGTVSVIYASTDARFLLCFGEAHNQPIYQHGSFVD